MKKLSPTRFSDARPASQLVLLAGLLFAFAAVSAMADDVEWNRASSMISPRWGHTGTSLADGRVLAAGGYGGGSNNVVDSAEVYDPASAIWTRTRPMSTPRAFHAAALLPDGTVLVAGGFNAQFMTVASAERYDPKTGRFSDAGMMTSHALA